MKVKELAVIFKTTPAELLNLLSNVGVDIKLQEETMVDKETEKSIRRRIPEENIIKCNIEEGHIKFEQQDFLLPNAIFHQNKENVEMTLPIEGLILGEGAGLAKVEYIEKINDSILYFLKVGELTLFSVEKGEQRYQVGESVNFDLDLTQITVEECGILPLPKLNRLSGSFVKVKTIRSNYEFFMKADKSRLLPSERICEKLFACKGQKIFSTDLIYEFSVKDTVVLPKDTEEKYYISGIVEEVLDYATRKFSKVKVGEDIILVEYNGYVGEEVKLDVDVDKVTIIDKAIDIIIV